MRNDYRIASNSTILLLFLVFIASTSAEAPVSVQSSVDNAQITMGDQITYTISIIADKDVTIVPPSPGVNLGAFEIRDYSITGPVEENGKHVYKAVYLISIYEVGEYTIPSVSIAYTKPGEPEKKIESQSISVAVKSIAPEDAQFRGIKAPHEKIKDVSHLYKMLGIAGGIILTIVGIILFIALRKKKIFVSKEPPRPAHIIAYEELNRLRSSDLLEKGDIKGYFVALALILKTYIWNRFQVMAVERTSEEILSDARNTSMNEEAIALLERFLQRCDLVKFAAYLPGAEESEATWELAKSFVDETRFKIELVSGLDEKTPQQKVATNV